MIHRSSIRVAIAVATTCLAVARAAAQTAERPVWKEGDSWTFAKTDLRRGGATEWSRKIREVRADGGYGVAEGTRVFVTDGNGQEEPRAGPEYKGKWYRWPLRVGDAWSFELPIRMEAGSGSQVVKREVVGVERIKVPAGEFECFKIVSSRTRMTYDARRMARPSYSSRTSYTTWWCPEIRFIAKEEEEWLDGYGGLERHESVLVSYRLAD